MKIDVVDVVGDTVRTHVEMTREEFGRYVLWKQIDAGMSYEECGAWLRQDFASYLDQLTTLTITEGAPELIGRQLWILKPATISFACRFE